MSRRLTKEESVLFDRIARSRRRQAMRARVCDFIGTVLAVLFALILVDLAVALFHGATDAAIKFAIALVADAATLLALGIYMGRTHA